MQVATSHGCGPIGKQYVSKLSYIWSLLAGLPDSFFKVAAEVRYTAKFRSSRYMANEKGVRRGRKKHKDY
jgi:hypothetical protein